MRVVGEGVHVSERAYMVNEKIKYNEGNRKNIIIFI